MVPRVFTSRLVFSEFGVNQLIKSRLVLTRHICTRGFLTTANMASNDSCSADEKFNLITRNLQVRA